MIGSSPAADRMQQIRQLTEISRAITYAASPAEVFQMTVDRALAMVSAEKALLMVVRDDGTLAVRASRGVDVALTRDFHEPLDESLLPHLAGLYDPALESFVGVPLVVAGDIVGILVVIRPAGTGTEQDEWLLSALADQAAFALEKTHLEEIGQFREQLVGIVSHDLRNPLNTIIVAAQILIQREGLGEKETELGRRIVRSALRSVKLIDQLLDLTRSRLGGGIAISPRAADLDEICRQVVDETELMHPDRPLRTSFTGDLVGVWDRDRLVQVVSNLIGNAVQHGEPRTPIDVRADGSEAIVTIEVTNRGPPIPADVLPFIFDAFRRGRSSSRAHGLGLGLFIAQQIAHSHGGSISITSSENEGTAVLVRLPRSISSARA
jgi:phosphoserine phosphatase RsbU/P